MFIFFTDHFSVSWSLFPFPYHLLSIQYFLCRILHKHQGDNTSGHAVGRLLSYATGILNACRAGCLYFYCDGFLFYYSGNFILPLTISFNIFVCNVYNPSRFLHNWLRKGRRGLSAWPKSIEALERFSSLPSSFGSLFNRTSVLQIIPLTHPKVLLTPPEQPSCLPYQAL